MTKKEGAQELEVHITEKGGMQQALSEMLKMMQKQLDAQPVKSTPSIDIQGDMVVFLGAQSFHETTAGNGLDSITVDEDPQSHHNLKKDTLTAPEPTCSIELNQVVPIEGTNQGQTNSTTVADDVDAFLDSIAMNIQQPIIQGDYDTTQIMATNSSNGHLSPNQNSIQRKSVRLAKKATLNVGKDPFQVAHNLLVKKLGDLAGEETIIDNPDFEFYAQHFERPINKDKMDAIKTLIEQNCKKPKKSNLNRKMQVGLEALRGVQLQ